MINLFLNIELLRNSTNFDYRFIIYSYICKKDIIMGLFKRFFVRKLIKFRLKYGYKDFTLKGEDDYNEKVCKSIIIRLINHKKSLFLIAPISMKRYIKNESLGIFIVLDGRRIKITNQVYNYDVTLTERNWERLSAFYDRKTEKIREDFESKMFSQISNSLHKVLLEIGEKS